MFGTDWDWSSVDWSYVVLLSISPLYGLYLFCLWFFQPLLDNERDKWSMKDYSFTDPKTKQLHAFPNVIEDDATIDLSLVIPAYNEESRIKLSLDPAIKYLSNRKYRSLTNTQSNTSSSDTTTSNNNTTQSNQSGHVIKPFTWEIIVVCDGCKDRTAQVVRDEYVSQWGTDRIRVLEYKVNEGKGYAVKQGMLHSRGAVIIFADADGASEIECLERLEKDLTDKLLSDRKKSSSDNNYDEKNDDESICLFDIGSDMAGICVGSRKDLQKKAEAERTLIRNFLMWGFHFCVQFIGGVNGNIRDTQCGFKMFTRVAVMKCVYHQKIRRWCFDPEQLYLAQLHHIPIVETGIKWEEVPGSKLSLLRASINMFREMMIYRGAAITAVWYNELFMSRDRLREMVAEQRSEFGAKEQNDSTPSLTDGNNNNIDDPPASKSQSKQGGARKRRRKGRKA